jgi:hypothetical protein
MLADLQLLWSEYKKALSELDFTTGEGIFRVERAHDALTDFLIPQAGSDSHAHLEDLLDELAEAQRA